MRFMTLGALALFSSNAFAQDVLVWSTGNSQSSTQSVADYLDASGQFTSVTAIDGTGQTLADLQAYDRVLFFTNGSGDSVGSGNVLGDYAAAGGYLVVATFSWADQGSNTLEGRFVTDGHSPFAYTGSSLYANSNVGTTDGSGFWEGINDITGYFRDQVETTPGATLHGSWADGYPLVASKGNVIAVNLFPVNQSVSGDFQQLFVNALGGEGLFVEPDPLEGPMADMVTIANTWYETNFGMANVLDEASPKANRRPSNLKAKMDTALAHLANGCLTSPTVENYGAGSFRDTAFFDGETLDGDLSNGTIAGGVITADLPDGQSFVGIQNRQGQFFAETTDGDYFLGRWVRIRGTRGVWVGLTGSCDDVGTPAETMDNWYAGSSLLP